MAAISLPLCAACNESSSAGPVPAASAPHEAAVHAPSASANRAMPPPPKPPPLPCKAAMVSGPVHVVPFVGGAPIDGGPIPISTSAILPDDAWIELGKAGKLAARDAQSTRETSYEGPGRFRVCIDHREEAWVQEGIFESIGGAGERPGAEQWVATPLGEARYDVGRWRIVTTPTTVEVRMAAGTGYLWPAEGVTAKYFAQEGGAPLEPSEEGWVRIDSGAGAKLTVAKPVLNPEGANAALERCIRAAKEAIALTAAIAEPDASLADLAPKDAVARRIAHAACSVAHLRIESLPPSPTRDASLEKVRTAEAGWQSLTPPSGHP